ncbi:uncharacterized protein LOC135683224 [Rhopilema esculentum]|uniref:uncharacterized protein LOC135683224 n=1 Tax=Rhopilema esculentum TaxID=499914 RepID=UPI0031E3CBEC
MDKTAGEWASARCMESGICCGPLLHLQPRMAAAGVRPFLSMQDSTSPYFNVFEKKNFTKIAAACPSDVMHKTTLYSNKDIVYVGDSFASNGSFTFHGDVCYRFNPGKCLKRKPEEDSSSLLPSRKQHITEERMAQSMQNLSLDNNLNLGSVKQMNDDSDFEDDSDIDDSDIIEQSLDPVFELHVDLKENFKKMTTILPDSILDDMVRPEDSNLAIVPYIPRDALFLKTLSPGKQEIRQPESRRYDEDSNDSFDQEDEMDVVNIES